MRILSLGHSAFLFEIAAPDGEPVRVLADPWITDYAVGDLMARFPRLRLDPRDLGPLDAIWISHAHTDHLDPESLLCLRAALDPFPPLVLPASLAHLGPLLFEILDGPDLFFLGEDEPVDLRGVTLSGFFNPAAAGSNEDDVMVLVAEGDGEVLLSESDAVLPWEDPALQTGVAEFLTAPGVRAAAWLTTKNQLEATMSMLAATGRNDRAERIERSRLAMADEIAALGDLGVPRLVGGQGLAAPPDVAGELNRVLFPVRVADRVRMEREAGRTAHELVPGQWHRIAGGTVEREPVPWLEILDDEADRTCDPESELVADFPVAPLRDEPRDSEAQAARILAYANDRFLPHFVGARRPPVESVLAEGGGEWRIRVRFGTTRDPEDRDLLLTFAAPRFAWAPAGGEPHEHVFANDVDDVLAGRADEFSTFCRAPLPAPTQHLWLSLGMPWLNPDLVERKLRFHFERASRGETNADYVLPFWRNP